MLEGMGRAAVAGQQLGHQCLKRDFVPPLGHVAMWEYCIYSPPGLSAHTRLDNSWELCGLTKNSPGELGAMRQSCLDRLLSWRLPPSLREMARETQSLAMSFVSH